MIKKASQHFIDTIIEIVKKSPQCSHGIIERLTYNNIKSIERSLLVIDRDGDIGIKFNDTEAIYLVDESSVSLLNVNNLDLKEKHDGAVRYQTRFTLPVEQANHIIEIATVVNDAMRL